MCGFSCLVVREAVSQMNHSLPFSRWLCGGDRMEESPAWGDMGNRQYIPLDAKCFKKAIFLSSVAAIVRVRPAAKAEER